MVTLREAIASAETRLRSCSETPRLDAEVLLAHVLRRDRAHLRAWPERPLGQETRQEFQRLVTRRTWGTPVAYLTGEREFWSRTFAVTEDVLIPRPETETLVELALAAIPDRAPCRILELGTGSGAIAITLALERPRAEVWAVELSGAALAVARRNAKRLGAERIHWLEGSWFEPLPRSLSFDLILSNPPYVDPTDPHLAQGDVRFEPRLALVAPGQGLSALRSIAAGARNALRPHGLLMLEHGADQGEKVREILLAMGYVGICGHRDLSGHPRIATARFAPPAS
ncbi:MAG TPA: peptide chain release factor N(5)-glutamine methyltransferase [Methylococcus sp.]|nr:peptide chain release factor N(5)-glutamine methyltransferase [Methylococcus sp.]